jgi:hypothetical protein
VIEPAARTAAIGYAHAMRQLLCDLVVLAAFGSAGCDSKACTTIGCSDQFSATLTRADGSFPAGVHKLDVTADGVMLSCSFTFAGADVFAACPGGLSVSVVTATTCTEIRMGDTVSLRCDPIPGQFIERLSVQGTPRALRIVQSVDEVALMDQTAAPTYQAARPNGADCEPVCQQASATFTLQ